MCYKTALRQILIGFYFLWDEIERENSSQSWGWEEQVGEQMGLQSFLFWKLNPIYCRHSLIVVEFKMFMLNTNELGDEQEIALSLGKIFM